MIFYFFKKKYVILNFKEYLPMKKIKFKIPFLKKKKVKKLESATLQGEKVLLRKLKVTDAIFAYDTFEEYKGFCYHPFNNLNTVDDVTREFDSLK